MAYNAEQILTLTAPTDANSNGTANTFSAGRACDKVRYWLTTVGATDGNHTIQVSPDGTAWANGFSVSADQGSATITGALEGPIRSVRIATYTGATQGTGSAKVAGILLP